MNVHQWSHFNDDVLDNSWRYASIHSTMDMMWLLIIQVKYFYNERIYMTSSEDEIKQAKTVFFFHVLYEQPQEDGT